MDSGKSILKSFNREVYFQNLKKGDVYIDCGANTGQEIDIALNYGAQIYAFEPNPFAFEVLRSKYSRIENVILIQQAVHNRAGKMNLYLHENSEQDQVYWSSGSSLLDYKSNVDKDRYVEIEVVRLSDFIKGLNKKVKLLKIDIEGVEFDVLHDLIDTNSHKLIEQIVCETHEKKIPELQTQKEKLNKKLNYLGINNINLNWI